MISVALLVLFVSVMGTVRCTTYDEPTLGRLQTVCSDGTRAVSGAEHEKRKILALLTQDID
jgi:hypothetical protein